MAWRDDLRPASFRGVPFEVIAADRDLGRKVVVHDYPLRDTASTEDLGRRPRGFKLEALIIGPDYMVGRAALDAALEVAGPGILIHPWHGQKSVTLLSATCNETTSEGGLARYQLEFIEENASQTPTRTIDTAAAINTAGDDLKEAASTEFQQSFSAKTASLLDSASEVLGKFTDHMDDLTSGLKAHVDGLSTYVNLGLGLRSQVLDLVLTPAELSASIGELISSVRLVASTPADAFNVLRLVMGFGDDLKPVTGTTPTRRAQAENQGALIQVIKRTAAAEAVKTVVDMTFKSYDEAVAVRDDLADRLDDIAVAAADAGQDTAWSALETAKSAVVQDITKRGGSLARLYKFTPSITTPALVLAYRLYDDTSDLEGRVQDVVGRNRIAHPGFVRGGNALEVTADV